MHFVFLVLTVTKINTEAVGVKSLLPRSSDKKSIGFRRTEMELRLLGRDCSDRENFEAINNEAFPSSEIMSYDEIFDFADRTDTDVLGIYDDDKFVGFIVLLKNAECGYVYYLAIDSRARSKGYGGSAIRKLMEDYSHLQIILDFEIIDESAENLEQRIRRKSFYLRNGFHETGRFTLLNGYRFEVVCNKQELRADAFMELIRVIHQYRPEFPDVLI